MFSYQIAIQRYYMNIYLLFLKNATNKCIIFAWNHKEEIMEKPFVFGDATLGNNFTDREKETERLLLNFTHGVNTILISPRRWRKTSLVKKVAQLAQANERKIVYMDIFSCRTEQGMDWKHQTILVAYQS